MRKHDKRVLYTLLLVCVLIIIACSLYSKSRAEGFGQTVRINGLIIRLIGGLGNQLFVYAAALLFKKTFDVPIFLIKDATTNRHSEKDYRFLMNGISPLEETSEIVANSRKFRFSSSDPYEKYDINEIPVGDTSYIQIESHYFQNYEMIKDVIGEVTDSIIPRCREMYKALKVDSESSAFIHVRRGDYLTDIGGERIISSDFYKQGLDRLNSVSGIKTIYIISDDIQWCKQQSWNTSKTIYFFDDPDELKTLYLMSQCWAGAVISNSTFSLWGAFLGAYGKTDMIVYPSNKHFLKDLPQKWIKI
jgi:hypothetical protein